MLCVLGGLCDIMKVEVIILVGLHCVLIGKIFRCPHLNSLISHIFAPTNQKYFWALRYMTRTFKRSKIGITIFFSVTMWIKWNWGFLPSWGHWMPICVITVDDKSINKTWCLLLRGLQFRWMIWFNSLNITELCCVLEIQSLQESLLFGREAM